MCNLTTSATIQDVIGILGVHLFAKGLNAAAARKSVLEEGGKDIAKSAKRAQAVLQAAEAASSAPVEQFSVNYAASSASGCDYCGENHPTGKANCPAADRFCSRAGTSTGAARRNSG